MPAPHAIDPRVGDGPWPRFAFLVPTYNAATTIEPLLDSLARQDRALSFEVVCADDASTDDTRERIARHPVGARLVALATNGGPSIARNEAARASTAELLVFLDADVILEDDTLAKIDAFRRAHPDAGAFHWPMSTRSLVPGLVGLYKTLLDRHMTRTPGGVRRVSFMSARGGLVERGAFFAAGGFDPRYARADIEDWEFSRRLAAHTMILHTDAFAIHHRQPASFAKNFGNYFRRAFLFARLFARDPSFDDYTETTPANSLATVLTLPATMVLATSTAFAALGDHARARACALAGALLLLPFVVVNGGFWLACARHLGVRSLYGLPAFAALRLAFNLAAALGVACAIALWPLGGWPYERRRRA